MRQSSKNQKLQPAISESIDGFFILDTREKKVVQNHSHDFTHYLCKYLNHAFTEDKVLENVWNELDLNHPESHFKGIIREVSEYYLMRKLALFLDAEVAEMAIETQKLRHFDRDDLAQLTATNRFLDLFSKPIDQRALFKSGTRNSSFSCAENGALFERIEWLLPEDSRMVRNEDSSFTIANAWFSFTVKTIFEAHMTHTPLDFCEVYLDLKRVARFYPALSVRFEIAVTYHNPQSYHEIQSLYAATINNFINELIKAFGKDYYFDHKLQWNQTRVILEVFQKRFDKMMEKMVKKR